MNEEVSDESGYIYILVNSSMPGVLKIGYTERDVEARAQELSNGTGVLVPFVVAYYAKCFFAPNAEAEIHSVLDRYRIAENREFFRVDIRQAIATVDEVCGRYQRLHIHEAGVPSREELNQKEDHLVEEATTLLFQEGKVWPSMIAGHLGISLTEAEHILTLLRGRGMINEEWEVTGYAAIEYQNRKDHARRMRWKAEQMAQKIPGRSGQNSENVPTFGEMTANDHLPYGSSDSPHAMNSRSGTPEAHRWSSKRVMLVSLLVLVFAFAITPILFAIMLLPVVIITVDQVRARR